MFPTDNRPNRGRRRFVVGSAMTLAALSSRPARAQASYPSRPIEVIVAYVPGGQGDLFARLVSERLTRALGQTFVVENRPGATGSLGARFIAKSKPDGYTLLLGQTGEMAVNASAMKEPGYDAVRDFRAVALVGNAPLVMAAPATAPYNTLKELLDLARGKPGSVAYASSGTATPGHLAAASLALATKTQMTHVPYKGGGQAITDLMGGQVQFFFSGGSSMLPHIKGGRLKALAVSTLRRMPALPDVPTVAEIAVPGFDFSLWGGYFAPQGTPDAIVTRLNAEINKVLREPEIRTRFEAESAAVEPVDAARFESFVKAETEKYARIIQVSGVRIE